MKAVPGVSIFVGGKVGEHAFLALEPYKTKVGFWLRSRLLVTVTASLEGPLSGRNLNPTPTPATTPTLPLILIRDVACA